MSLVKAQLLLTKHDSYNRYLAVAARVLRRSLKEEPRLQAEKRGTMELRFAKWEVRLATTLRMLRLEANEGNDRTASKARTRVWRQRMQRRWRRGRNRVSSSRQDVMEMAVVDSTADWEIAGMTAVFGLYLIHPRIL